MKKRVLVLGQKGMAAHAILRALNELPTSALDVVSVGRAEGLDVTQSSDAIVPFLTPADYVINAIGLIKPYITDTDTASVVRALLINAQFPHMLAEHYGRTSPTTRIITMATDCVYRTAQVPLTEEAPHDAIDVYGKTKSLGEVHSENVHNLRVSIIGREIENKRSLVEWFLGNAPSATLKGFVNHRWNGVTTDLFGKIIAGIVLNDTLLPSVQHIVPADVVTKYELLELLNEKYGTSYTIEKSEASVAVDRALSTIHPDIHTKLWQMALEKSDGQPLTIREMVQDYL